MFCFYVCDPSEEQRDKRRHRKDGEVEEAEKNFTLFRIIRNTERIYERSIVCDFVTFINEIVTKKVTEENLVKTRLLLYL